MYTEYDFLTSHNIRWVDMPLKLTNIQLMLEYTITLTL